MEVQIMWGRVILKEYTYKIDIVVPTESIKEICVDTINLTRQSQRRKTLDYRDVNDPD